MLLAMSRNPEEPVYNRIEEVRAALGLSRQDLADKAGVHYQTIGYLEREEYSPSLVLALRIAKSLNKEVSELFSLTPLKKGKKGCQKRTRFIGLRALLKRE